MPRKKQELEVFNSPPMYDSAFATTLKQGMATPFWQGLKKVVEQNIDVLKDAVIHDDSLSVNETVSKRDYVRKWIGMMEEMLLLPEKIADSIERPNFQKDPFKEMENGLRGIIPTNDEPVRTR